MDTATPLPFSAEAEQSVLGAVLINPDVLNELVGILTPDHFYLAQHREIYEAMLALYDLNIPVDIVTVLDRVVQNGVFSEADAKVYLAQLVDMVPTSQNARHYAAIVRDKATLRALINASEEIQKMCYEASADEVPFVLDAAEQRIFEIAGGRVNTSLTPLRTVVQQRLEHLNLLAGPEREQYLGLPTHFKGLDRILNGLNKSDLILIAARPGMGKTSFALNIAQNVAQKSKKKVVIFTLEMSKEQLADRLIAATARIDNYKLLTGELAEEDWEYFAAAAATLSPMPILIDDSSDITVSQMKAKLRRVKDLDLVIIDYLQLMNSGRRSDNRVQEISEITRSLKLMAKDLNVPVIVLSQLSRGPEARENKRPRLSDLRESGSIEQDADVVLFLYRDDYYHPESEERNICECSVAKNRHGSTSMTKLTWEGRYTRFGDVERVHSEP